MGQLAELLAHSAAMYKPTLRQLSNQIAPNMVANAARFDNQLRSETRSELTEGGDVVAIAKPATIRIQHRIKEWVMKRPAAAFKRTAASLKRNPFSLKRLCNDGST